MRDAYQTWQDNAIYRLEDRRGTETDGASGKINDLGGGIALVDRASEQAALWKFTVRGVPIAPCQ